METVMGRGDLNSQERGSGARTDNGKSQWGLMPLGQICQLIMNPRFLDKQPSYEDCVSQLALFQITGKVADALSLLSDSYLYLMEIGDYDFWDACEEVIRVWEHGEQKYAAFNWMKGMSWNSIIGCYMRHIVKIAKGTAIDEESGRLHAAHLVCNAMMLVHYSTHYPEGNDLPTRWYMEKSSDQLQRGSEPSDL
jgi:hypothetical protein